MAVRVSRVALGSAAARGRLARCALTVALAGFACDSRLSSQSTQGAVIFGRVVDAVSKRGVPEVVVTASERRDSSPSERPVGAWPPSFTPSNSSGAKRVLADSNGRFMFTGLPPGSYSLVATAARVGYQEGGFIVEGGVSAGAYLNAEYGQSGPNGPGDRVDVGEGQRAGEIQVLMWPAGSIDGIVTDEAGEPLAELVVGAVRTNGSGALMNGPTTKTDDRGAFHLGFLMPGEYYVFVPQTHGTIPSDVATPNASEMPPDFSRQLLSTGIDPVGARPTVGNSAYVTPLGNAGIYRGSLPASPSANGRLVYPTSFYPGVADLRSAERIVLAIGDHRTGLQLALQPVDAVTIRGQLLRAGRPEPYFGLHLVPSGADETMSLFEAAYAVTDASGRFEFVSVPSGQYRLLAFKDPPRDASIVASQDRGAWAIRDLVLDKKPVDDLLVNLNEGFDIRGKLRLLDALPTDRLPGGSARVSMPLAYPRFRRTGQPVGSPIDANGAFQMLSVCPGRYLLAAPQIPGWFVASVTVGGREFGDRPFEIAQAHADIAIAYARKFVGLVGAARVSEDALRGGLTAYLFPADRSAWRDATVMRRSFQAARISKSGQFQFVDIPAGDYVVVATRGDEGDRWTDIDCLTKLAAAGSAVRIDLGRTANVTVSRVVTP